MTGVVEFGPIVPTGWHAQETAVPSFPPPIQMSWLQTRTPL